MTAQRLQLTWYNKDKALIPTETGKYGYTWVDPSDPRYCETHTLVYDDYVQGSQTPKSDEFAYSERADLEPQDDNLLILGESGDVLEALTRVPELAEKYVGKVKLIYIDPPFNTAQTFASYEDNLEHSIWLTMMRDRLLHLKKLLADDGSIWVHLDDVEVHRMRVLMDEVFGAGNYVAEVMWHKTTSSKNDNSAISLDHDVILVYKKSTEPSWNGLERSAASEAAYSNPDNDPRGRWREDNYKMKNGSIYPIVHPLTGELVYPPSGQMWRFSQETHKWHVADNRIWWGKEYNYRIPKVKRFRSEVSDSRVPSSVWGKDETDTNRRAKQHLAALFPGLEFSTPKPERLLERIIHIATNPGDIVLDVFAGSGTTAAVAQKMGRRWVTCELLESTFTTFTRPRLEKVVGDQDPGGITRTNGERVDATEDGLPDGVSPEDAAKFTSVLNKLIKDDPELKKSVEVKALKAASRTRRSKEVVNWRGGGGFQVAHLSPACYDYAPELDRVMLTEAATGQTLVESVAANLGFALLHPDDDYIFDARRGNALLKVVEGVATTEIVDWLASQIQPGETIVLAATTVMDGVRQHLRKLVKGSRVVALPDDVFRYSEGGDQ
ncbi:DNA restriction-modification system, DNA methylase [Propionibacterium freudenreichii]|uniref:site-specific DNA-methyltransferase n=1 Tax=Propionibacterium freudenreichii TaxID=1744 RepID=UPI000543532C|nr:site-specific DNA-methyltransferase [Propionibacterium freudenreichii]CEH06948.1 DNA methylase (site-specific DNA-methyltransferase adenine-specific, Putative type III restriction-modification system) [Propionibacterium freudenreichii]SCQ73622.1 DNA restriction-modification system, DNA methylase [Propionibacterium freudenreichii]SCQ82055.1 DNA restriction-modification system, DNA methylase [Propionibacterium freudenreichii]